MSKRETSKSIKDIADIMLADKTFKDNILKALKQITADGKIDKSDIPIVVGLVLDNYNSFAEYHVSKEQVGEVLGYICSKILHDQKLIPDAQVNSIEKLISNSVYLVLTNPLVENLQSKCCKSMFSCCLPKKVKK